MHKFEVGDGMAETMAQRFRAEGKRFAIQSESCGPVIGWLQSPEVLQQARFDVADDRGLGQPVFKLGIFNQG